MKNWVCGKPCLKILLYTISLWLSDVRMYIPGPFVRDNWFYWPFLNGRLLVTAVVMVSCCRLHVLCSVSECVRPYISPPALAFTTCTGTHSASTCTASHVNMCRNCNVAPTYITGSDPTGCHKTAQCVSSGSSQLHCFM